MTSPRASRTSPLIETFASAITPDPVMTVSEWADKYRFLPKESAREAGRWKTSRTPYMREIMDCLSPQSRIQQVVFMKGTQLGATECGYNWLGYIVHICPGPVLMVLPTEKSGEKLVKTKFMPAIRATPVLRELIGKRTSGEMSNTVTTKGFPGGMLYIATSNSPSDLASVTIRFLFLDEVDRYEGDSGGEGDPVSLAMRRTDNFGSAKKVFMASSPTIKGESRIERAFLETDQRRYFVPCPNCGHYDWIRWGNIRWEEGKPETAGLFCEACEKLIESHRKDWLLARGQWRPTTPGDGYTAGFHLSRLYSPWSSWPEVVRDFLRSKESRSTLKVWVNTILADTWDENDGETVDDSVLYARREDWGMRIPMEAGVITCGVDVQANRIEAEVVAWGRGKESWSIEYRTFYGDPRRPTVWKDLDTFLQKTYTHASGVELPIACACIDTGDNTQHVYDFVRPRQTRRIYGVKGANQAGLPVVNRPTSSNKGGILLFTVGTDTAKADIYSYLKIMEFGPGYTHFPLTHEREYFDQLTAEKVVTRFNKGFAKREWIKTRDRNEALDCRVYALAALYILNPEWDKLFENLGKKALARKTPPAPESQDAKRPQLLKRKNWINGWRR